MKNSLFCFIFITCSLIGQPQETGENIAISIRSSPLEEQLVSRIPKGREPEVYDALISQNANSTLLRLGHVPTMVEYASKFREIAGKSSQMQRTIEASGSPYFIRYLAPILYENGEVVIRNYGEHGDFDYGQSATAAILIGKIILVAPEFPTQMKTWAKANLATPRPTRATIEAARAWWAQNQVALEAGNFSKILAPTSDVLRNSNESNPTRQISNGPKIPELPSNLQSNESSGPVSNKLVHQESSGKTLLVFGVIGFGLAVIALWGIKKKK